MPKPCKAYAEVLENLHKKHRMRMRKTFRDCSINGFHEHNVLEMLLFYSIPRKDTNEIAHRLIHTFGSFSAVFEAPYEALLQVNGIGVESATFIKFIHELIGFYESSKIQKSSVILNPDNSKDFFEPSFITTSSEKFVVVYIDGNGRLIKSIEFSQNQDDMVRTDFSVIMKSAIFLNAKGIIVAHNHPGGFAVPSNADVALTEKLSNLCKTFNIVFCDHLIFGDNDVFYFSKFRGLPSGTCAF